MLDTGSCIASITDCISSPWQPKSCGGPGWCCPPGCLPCLHITCHLPRLPLTHTTTPPTTRPLQARDWDLLLTAETHNFPCAVAPYPGAETGAGGRIRDTHATGIGSIMGASTSGYCVGNLHMDG